jgi:hypothetical protein
MILEMEERTRINLLDSVNPLDCDLWPKEIVNKILKSRLNIYLQLGGWSGLNDGDNDLPCLVREDGHKYAVDMGEKNGKQKDPRQQYPNSYGMGLHKWVALVTIPNPDPENCRQVGHINDIHNPMTRMLAADLHKLFGGNHDVCKLVWGSWNLSWISESKNTSDSTSEEHKAFKEKVPYDNICSYVHRLDEESKKEKSIAQAEADVKQYNRDYAGWMGERYEWQAYFSHMDDFLINFRNYNKIDYQWMIHQFADNQAFDNFEEQIKNLPRSIRRDIRRKYDFEVKLLWSSMPSV